MPPPENDRSRLAGRLAVQSHDQKNTARIPRPSDTYVAKAKADRRIGLTGANVWPAGRNPLAEHVPGMLRRLVQEAAGTWNGISPLEQHIEAHARRVLIECMTEATAMRWEREAVKWEATDLEVAAACREKAYMVRQYGIPGLGEDLDAVVRDQLQQGWERAA